MELVCVFENGKISRCKALIVLHPTGPAHAVYFATYELVKELAGGNVDAGHHPIAAGELFPPDAARYHDTDLNDKATSGAAATIASDALMNPFDGEHIPKTKMES